MWHRFLLVLASLSFLTLALISCSSDGGGGDDDTGEPTEITQENFDDVVGFVSDQVPGCSTAAASASSRQNPLLLVLGRLSMDMADELQATSVGPASPVQPRQTETTTTNGSCGGTLTTTLTVNENTGDISGSFNSDEFCEDVEGTQLRVDGSADFSGNVDVDTGDLTLEASIDDLNVQSNGDNVNIDLDELSLTISDETIVFALDDLEITDSTEGETFAVPSLLLTSTGEEPARINLTAEFIFPDEGSVNVVTVNQLVLLDDVLQSGSIRVEGANNTQILVTATNNMLEFQGDTDGDGTTDDLSAQVRCTD